MKTFKKIMQKTTEKKKKNKSYQKQKKIISNNIKTNINLVKIKTFWNILNTTFKKNRTS